MNVPNNPSVPAASSRLPGLRGAKIVVATDLSTASDEALVEAAHWARLLGSRLVVLHVIPFPVRSSMLFPQNVGADVTRLVELQTAVAASIFDRVSATTGLTRDQVDVHVETGSVAASIVRKAEEWGAGMVVVGSHGSEGFGRRILGTTAERVVRHAHCPVLVSRWQAARGQVLAATDLSDPSMPAVEAAAELAGLAGAALTLLHAVEADDTSVSGGLWSNELRWPAPVPAADEALKGRVREVLRGIASSRGITASVNVAEGTPAHAIMKAAEEMPAELVVVGCRGRSGLSRLLLGSTAEKVVRAMPCSVLVVRLASETS